MSSKVFCVFLVTFGTFSDPFLMTRWKNALAFNTFAEIRPSSSHVVPSRPSSSQVFRILRHSPSFDPVPPSPPARYRLDTRGPRGNSSRPPAIVWTLGVRAEIRPSSSHDVPIRPSSSHGFPNFPHSSFFVPFALTLKETRSCS